MDMGLYDTPQKDMGRLSYQMWRATAAWWSTPGIHSKGWSKAQAVAFMKDNTALTDANIEAEVNRYISNPGQALAYKIGQLKIHELRARAEKELGRQVRPAPLPRRGARPGLGAAGRAGSADRRLDRGGESAKPESLLLGRRVLGRRFAGSRSRACLMTCVRQPVKPAGPTGEQLLIPVAPTVSSARARLAHAWRLWREPLLRSFSGIR